MAEKTSLPMIPEANWWILREQFKKAIPSAVSVSYLKSLLSLTSDQSAKNLIAPLRQIKLIDENNKPTPRANDWRNDTQYPLVCTEIIDELYPNELRDLFPDSTVEPQKAVDWFKHNYKLGDSSARRISSLFLLLKDGHIKNGDEVGKTTKRSVKKEPHAKSTNGKSVPNTSNNEPLITRESIETNNDTTAAATSDRPHSNPSLHIDLQIHISPDASPQQIDSIFASISKHLYDKN